MGKKFDIFVNPFRYVAGWQSVAIGLSIALMAAWVASLNGTHYPDVLSVKVGAHLSFYMLLFQWGINWGSISVTLYVAGLLFSASKPRFVDVLGTQGMARLPYLFAAFFAFSPALERFGQMILYTQLGMGAPVDMSVAEIAFAVVQIFATILLTIWMVAWMYRAFSVSVNLKGGKAIAVFVVGLIVSVLMSMGLFWIVWKHCVA